jgi:uncharacterized repeat protein (TIGR01451 family)
MQNPILTILIVILTTWLGLMSPGFAVHSQTYLTNTAIVSAEQPDPNPNNNISTVTDTIVGATPKADLKVTKTVDKSSAKPGDTLIYTLTYKNLGPDVATSASLIDTLPSLVTYQSSTINGVEANPTQNGQTLIFNLGDVAINSQVEIKISVKVNFNASGALSNATSIYSPLEDPDPTNNQSQTHTTVVLNLIQTITVRTGGPAVLATGTATVAGLSALGMWFVQRRQKFKQKIQLK